MARTPPLRLPADAPVASGHAAMGVRSCSIELAIPLREQPTPRTRHRSRHIALKKPCHLPLKVTTGGPSIESVNREYKQRRDQLRVELQHFGLTDPYPWSDLWRWYGYWSQNLATYGSRRAYVADLASPVLDQLQALIDGRGVDDVGALDEQTWPALEQRLTDAKRRLDLAVSQDDWQDTGRRCREILIDLAGLVYTDAMLPTGQEVPRGSDAKERLALAGNALFVGPEHKELRGFVKAAWDLANKVTHSGSIMDVETFATLQATVLLVRLFERAAALSR